MSKVNQFDASALLVADIQSISAKAGVRQTVSDMANAVSQSAKAVADVIELARYELIDMKQESRNRLIEKYSKESTDAK